MTDYQRNMIHEYRVQGMGYKAIGNILGLSRDVVRGYCRKNSLCGDADLVKMNVQVSIEKGILCLNCHKALKQPKTGRPRRFCSEHCRRSWWNDSKHRDEGVKKAFYNCTCAFCDKEFLSYGKRDRKYCSHDCYIKDRFGVMKDGI